MNIEKLENDIQHLVTNLDKNSFIYDLLSAYGQPKASITRLHKGDYNLAKLSGDIIWKKKLFFRAETIADLHDLIDTVQKDHAIIKYHPRFMIVTDFETLLAVDTKTNDTLDIPFKKLPKHYDFFLPWAGIEKAQYQPKDDADIKAAVRMGRLYDIIRQDNPDPSDESQHALNLFLSRLLFCFFAEDTGIFEDGQFTNALASHTATDGSNLQAYLQRLFTVLNSRERSSYPQFLQEFPYVNGGLFADDSPVPQFSATARKIIVESGSLNWKQINPDIFGSMMQAVVNDDLRGSLGMHYTSVVNIMKVIKPLFLDDLVAELERAGNNKQKLENLLNRLQHLRIFDPACGSGNFLIIAYKELSKLEIEIFKRLHSQQLSFGLTSQVTQLSFRFTSRIKLSQFYGIEIDDFAHETAKLSLWLAEHQMSLAFKEVFGVARPALPLQEGGNIIWDNATRLDWEEICPKDKRAEIYILGNPPYAGQRNHTDFQRKDMTHVFFGERDYKKLDYISCWFYKASKYLDDNSKFSFVTTNSICQGLQVSLLWSRLFDLSVEIFFAYAPFKWSNNAKNNAGVTVTIIGVRPTESKPKFIFQDSIRSSVQNINAYLIQGSDVIVKKRLTPLSNLPKMQGGNQPREGGYLMLSDSEKNKLVTESPQVLQFIRPLMGSNEFIKGIKRWCIWIDEEQIQEAKTIPQLSDRIRKVHKHRLAGNTVEKSFAHVPYRFVTIKRAKLSQILIPIVSSENRKYIPIGMLDKKAAVTSKAFVIFDSEPFVFCVLNSLMHIIWIKTVSGTRGTSISYSSQICYNTFPFPEINEAQKETLEEHVFKVLDAREQHSEKTMAQLYDPDKMPANLRQAHHEMDMAVEQCYRKQPFKSDEERLEYLFTLYEKMIAAEKKQG